MCPFCLLPVCWDTRPVNYQPVSPFLCSSNNKLWQSHRSVQQHLQNCFCSQAASQLSRPSNEALIWIPSLWRTRFSRTRAGIHSTTVITQSSAIHTVCQVQSPTFQALQYERAHCSMEEHKLCMHKVTGSVPASPVKKDLGKQDKRRPLPKILACTLHQDFALTVSIRCQNTRQATEGTVKNVMKSLKYSFMTWI